MCWYNADISSGQLNQLNLSRRPSRECECLCSQATEPQRIIGGFEDSPEFWGTLEFVDANTVLEDDGNMRSR
jgi:hypothetical protein